MYIQISPRKKLFFRVHSTNKNSQTRSFAEFSRKFAQCKIILENEYEDLDSAQKRLNILSFDQNVFVNKAKTMYKVANSLLPQYIIDFFQLRADSLPETALRSVTNHNFTIP